MELAHVGILTYSLEDSMGEFGGLYGFEDAEWIVREVEFPAEAIKTGRGSHMRTAIARLGGITIELIQPLDPQSYHSSELKKKGPGLHHLAYICTDCQPEAIAAELERGGQVVWEAELGEKHPVYVESSDGSQVFEFINYIPGA